MKHHLKYLAFALIVALSVTACDRLTTTPIGEIAQNPRAFDGKTVTIKGKVTEAFSLFVIKYFSLKDETGQMIVVTNKPLPKRGTSLTVEGMVREAFSIGDRQLLVLIENTNEK